MTVNYSALWHKTSFDRFFYERLPRLLAQHLPLGGYETEITGRYTCKLTLMLSTAQQEVEVTYSDLPYPDEEGIFLVRGELLAVVPRATHDDLATTEVFCVGEQLYEYLQGRLGKAPSDLVWDMELARAWLPLEQWISEFFDYRGKDSWATCVQPLDQVNWLARHSQLRRVSIQNRQHLFTPSHFGRACPFETPEGPNIGRIVQVALGAEIRDDRLVIVDDRPEVALGLEAVMIPLLEHNEPSRLLMGANMLRQWMVPSTPEAALIQSGNEPDARDFWCGRNLLTAFVSWGEGTYEDGIVISESCARRLSYDSPIEPGDKLSNRHGTKGVVSRILPDQQMPHLTDGTPIELLYSFITIHARANFGQVREAVLSRIARAQGQPMIVPPFHSPGEQQIHTWLELVGLAEDGMEDLMIESDGKQVTKRATVGEVYWGRPFHLAGEKVRAATTREKGQLVNEYDYYVLRDVGAFGMIREFFSTDTADFPAGMGLEVRTDNDVNSEHLAPQFRQIMRNLEVVGIAVKLSERGLSFHLQDFTGEALVLAQPVAHPWLRDHMIARIGVREDVVEYHALVNANTRMKRILVSGAPESLKQQVQAQLAQRVQELCAVLLKPVQFRSRVAYSGRAVAVPATNLGIDQVGLSQDIAWTLFEPVVSRELDAEEVRMRSEKAMQALDEIMACSWVVIHRAPTLTPQTFLAFHPVRTNDHVIHLHPLVCRLLQMDFDGDQVSVFLPLSENAQQEAGKYLSVAGHLKRSPELLKDIIPNGEALWGLAYQSFTRAHGEDLLLADDDAEQTQVLGQQSDIGPEGMLTYAQLEKVFSRIMQRDGVDKTLEILERLMHHGFEATRVTGASISPFVGDHFALPVPPEEDEIEQWEAYKQEINEWLAADNNYEHNDLGTQLLAIKSGARGEIQQLTGLIRTRGVVKDVEGNTAPIRHGYRDGLSAVELFALAVGARERLAQVLQEWGQIEQEIHRRGITKSFTVIARAMRAEHPGMVFAHAASIAEVDPLNDRDSRLFVGLSL